MAADKHWFAIRTNIKCETRARRSLERKGYEVYLPERTIERRHHRTKAVLVHTFPLFMRYLFVAQPANGADWYTLRRCDGVEKVLGIDGPMPIPAKEVNALRSLQADMAFDDTRAARIHRKEIGRTIRETTRMRFPKGTRFRTEVGGIPLVATVTSVNAKGAVEAMINIFGRLSPVEIAASEVERLEIVEEEQAA